MQTDEAILRATDYLDAVGVLDSIAGTTPSDAIPPDVCDLARLHREIRTRRSFTVLEFGVGYSTLVLADALAANAEEWAAIDDPPTIRNRHMFQLFTVDTSQAWMEVALGRLPIELQDRVHPLISAVRIGTFRDQLCHFYDELPDVIPDFVYLDGPDPAAVQGQVQGMSFQCAERTVMAGDLLVMEPTLLPGCFVSIDGRTNNARFLERNLQRPYRIVHDPVGDYTTFELDEPRLGRHNILGPDILPPPALPEL